MTFRRPPNLKDPGAVLLFIGAAAIIDADGRHSPEEMEWAVELSATLKRHCS